MKAFVPLLLSAFVLGGCATMVRGTSQNVSIETPGVSGAECLLVSEAIGEKKLVSPASITLPRSEHSVQVRCSKQCYEDATGYIPSSADGMAAANVLAGGVIGLSVDAATGALNRYEPVVQIPMTAIKNCGKDGKVQVPQPPAPPAIPPGGVEARHNQAGDHAVL